MQNNTGRPTLTKNMWLFLAITGMLGVAIGLSDPVLSNYFNQVYNISAQQRGLIEFPRELPGLICFAIIAFGSFLGDIKLAIIAQVMSVIGMLVLGFVTPTFAVMLIFLFVYSTGVHMYMPLADSIFITTSEIGNSNKNIGTAMGRYKSTFMIFQLLAGLLVFVGFRTGFFSFEADTKWVFVVAAFFFLIGLLLFIPLKRINPTHKPEKRVKFKLDKDYKLFYILAAMNGAQKQIMLVFGPWVLIEILGKGPDTIAILVIVSAFCGIFFTKYLGKWIDRFGIKNLLLADAISFILVYVIYGLICGGYESGALPIVGAAVLLSYIIFVLDKMSMNMNMIRVLYLKSIVKKPQDLPATLSTGISLDHVLTIGFAIFSGFVWDNYGARYVFFMAAAFSLVNLAVSLIIKYGRGQSEALAE